MATIRCPQCGTDIEEGTTEFCPNPNCGFPLSFSKTPEDEATEPAMERRPLEKAPVVPTQPVPAPTPPVTPTPVVPTPTPAPAPAPAPPKKRANPGLLIGGVLIAVVAVVVGLVVFLSGGDEDEEEPQRTSQKEPTGELAFTRADPEGFVADLDQVMHRVVAGEDQLIAVGSDGEEDFLDAAVWTSADGTTWTRVPGDPAIFGGDSEQEMLGITQTEDGYVIVGEEGPHNDEDAAVWVSDGVVFERVPVDAALGGEGPQTMLRALSSEGTVIAVGKDYSPESGTTDAGLWKSRDGLRWARANFQPSLGGEDAQLMRTLVEFGDGFVGAGREQTSEGMDAAVWKSDAGTDFERILGTSEDTFGGSGEQQIYTVTAGGPGVVAVGAADSGAGDLDAAVWVSEDGEVWERAAPDALGGPGTQVMLGVTPTPAGLVAVGYGTAESGAEEEGLDGAIWRSADGLTWERLPGDSFGGPGEQQIKNAVVYRDTVIAVGWDSSRGDYDAAVWTAPLAGGS
jgi:hypothetical protein